jgi:hypothetical protein
METMASTVDVSDSLLRQVGIDSAKLARQIADAKRAAVLAIRAVEARLVEELAGTRLRGAPNLVPDWQGVRFFGWRLRGHADAPLGGHGVGALVLTPAGRLCMVQRGVDSVGCVTERPVLDEELFAEDVQCLAKLLLKVLPLHCANAAAAGARFARLEALAEGIRVACEVPW